MERECIAGVAALIRSVVLLEPFQGLNGLDPVGTHAPYPPLMSNWSPESSTTFIIVRHGQTVWNAEGRWQGWLDSDLTATGREQATEAAAQLKEYHIDAAYSSDSGRAIETARVIAELHSLQVRPAKELRERFYGEFEGLNTEEIEARFPGTRYEEGRDLRATWRPPGGETLEEVRDRVISFIRELVQKHPGETVLLATHSGVVRVVDSISTGETLEDIWNRAPGNACIFILQADHAANFRVVRHFCTIT